jgi:hypothetical protein
MEASFDCGQEPAVLICEPDSVVHLWQIPKTPIRRRKHERANCRKSSSQKVAALDGTGHCERSLSRKISESKKVMKSQIIHSD